MSFIGIPLTLSNLWVTQWVVFLVVLVILGQRSTLKLFVSAVQCWCLHRWNGLFCLCTFPYSIQAFCIYSKQSDFQLFLWWFHMISHYINNFCRITEVFVRVFFLFQVMSVDGIRTCNSVCRNFWQLCQPVKSNGDFTVIDPFALSFPVFILCLLFLHCYILCSKISWSRLVCEGHSSMTGWKGGRNDGWMCERSDSAWGTLWVL